MDPNWTSTQAKPVGASFNSKYTGANSSQLRKNMGLGPGDGDAHHMVASTHQRAQPARDILDFYQIDINSPGVGAELSNLLHHGRALHSHDSIDDVIVRLQNAVRKAGGPSTATPQWRQGKANALRELRKLRSQLQDPNFRYKYKNEK